MKKTILLVFLILLIITNLFAIDVNSNEIYNNQLVDSNADFILMQTSFKNTSMVADYKQTTSIKRLNKKLVSSGEMILIPGKGIAWFTQKPYASTMLIGRDFMKQKIGSKTVVMDVSENQIYLSIADALESIFAGNFKNIKEVFATYFFTEGAVWYLGLIPKDKNVASFVENITIKGTLTVEVVLMKEKVGDEILYEFTNVEQRELTETEKEAFNI